jgi:trans-aconitate 2-methyltransferase
MVEMWKSDGRPVDRFYRHRVQKQKAAPFHPPLNPMKWNALLYDDRHAFVTQYGEGVVEWLAPTAGERVLDIGSGTGHLTRKIADAGAIVSGLDSSKEMIESARKNYPQIEWILGNAADFAVDQPYDAIFSNAALHWVRPPESAVRCMANALVPQGRFIVEFGGRGNVHQIDHALTQSLYELSGKRIAQSNYFPSIAQYTGLLEQNRIEVMQAWLFDRPTRLEDGESGLENWIWMFRKPLVESLVEGLQAELIQRAKARLRATLFRDGAWYADYRRLRIRGIKRAGDGNQSHVSFGP